jgi:hypothetical protein
MATHRISVERSFMTIPLLTASKQFVMLIGNGGIIDPESRSRRDAASHVQTNIANARPE